MAIRLRRPSGRQLRELAAATQSDDLTYAPVGITASDESVDGYRRDRWSTSLGRGSHVFDAAAHAIRTWQIQRGSGLVVEASSPPHTGDVVAMAAPMPIGYIDVVCRVVDVVDEADRSGFTYGTLSVHPAQGEESFMVVRAADGSVTFEIVAVSRPRHVLARAAPPVARWLQRRATNRYLDAMVDAVGGRA